MLINTSDNFINNNSKLKKIHRRLEEMTSCWKKKASFTVSNRSFLVHSHSKTQIWSNVWNEHLFLFERYFLQCHSSLAQTETAHSLLQLIFHSCACRINSVLIIWKVRTTISSIPPKAFFSYLMGWVCFIYNFKEQLTCLLRQFRWVIIWYSCLRLSLLIRIFVKYRWFLKTEKS